MKKSLPVLIISFFVLFLNNPALAMSFKAKKPTWSDIYYKRSPVAKGWKYIIIHHSATNAGSAASFHRYHSNQGYGGLCYHFVIGNGNGAKDGQVQEGFRWKEQISGTHVDNNSWYHNIFGIGICLVGNFEKQNPTEKQISSLEKLIKHLSKKYNIPKENILGHSQVPLGDISWNAKEIKVTFYNKETAPTLCPGKNLLDEIKNP